MSRLRLLEIALALALGALIAWALLRGDDAELRAAIDSALAKDSISKAENDSLRAANDSLEAAVVVLESRLGAALDEVDSLVARPVRVIRVMVPPDTGTGPVVPVDVVLKSDHDRLALSCSAASVLCRQTTDSLRLLANERLAGWDAATGRADSLRRRVEAFPVPKQPSRWGIGAAGGYAAAVSNGQVCTGPGGSVGVTFNFR